MTYPVNSIADYIIEYAKNLGLFVNNLKLQKILYFLEARFLDEQKKSLFNEEIEKWQYGPVVPEVYHRFNHLGAEKITHVPVEFDFMSLLEETQQNINLIKSDKSNSFSTNDKLIIDNTIDKLIRFDPFYLVEETHRHSSWRKDEEKINSGIRHIKYDRKEIERDFKENPHFQLWKS